ncbi:hypothetical protein MPHL21000_08655 [Mycolicibacterium phlei DSM 43239 = CCUG 21000]|uniref:Uncharacterized protein n=1 Tax=Mycolicibacterium phlei DSM 43239 = CCUG 21000 TaxID=1226750 RepID=A0A5N5V5U9_MYCPH|nr:hypothetical protein MPHL21000_08655 [Mycolicibacterium phlei DSM 43239 = CCUG 21000]
MHCSWLICWMRASEGGGASGPYSLPGNARMSTVWATSKRCSWLQSTISAASGVRSGQFRQSPALACEKVSLPRGPSEMVLAVSPLLGSDPGSTVITPAMRIPPSAINNSARLVAVARRSLHHAARSVGWSSAASGSGASAPIGRSGASNIRSIVTGVSHAVTSDAVVKLCGCA